MSRPRLHLIDEPDQRNECKWRDEDASQGRRPVADGHQDCAQSTHSVTLECMSQSAQALAEGEGIEGDHGLHRPLPLVADGAVRRYEAGLQCTTCMVSGRETSSRNQ